MLIKCCRNCNIGMEIACQHLICWYWKSCRYADISHVIIGTVQVNICKASVTKHLQHVLNISYQTDLYSVAPLSASVFFRLTGRGAALRNRMTMSRETGRDTRLLAILMNTCCGVKVNGPSVRFSVFSCWNCQEKMCKASANKIKILVFFIWTPHHLTYFGWTFAAGFFPGVYHPQDTRDEKVSNQRIVCNIMNFILCFFQFYLFVIFFPKEVH